MYYDLLKTELFKQKEVYLAVKAGERDTVCYKPYQDKEYGTQDANYTNRLRLAYYLLYGEVDDEEVIAWLFEEELKDREENSFQGIGAALEVLTFLLKKYNVNHRDDDLHREDDLHRGDGLHQDGDLHQGGDLHRDSDLHRGDDLQQGGDLHRGGNLHRYDDLIARAKNANFDCACGYDVDLAMVEKLADNDLLDCIYLCQDMKFLAVMEPLVEQWRASVTEWGESERTSLIRFYSFLGKEEKNEVLYQEQLALAKQKGRKQDVVRAYGDFIRHYLERGMAGMAHRYLDEVRELAECPEIRRVRLMGDLLEEAFEVVCAECAAGKEVGGGGENTKELWEWAKAELLAMTNRYGNLYQKGIAAAQAIGDAYAAQLEQEYKAWWEKWHIG